MSTHHKNMYAACSNTHMQFCTYVYRNAYTYTVTHAPTHAPEHTVVPAGLQQGSRSGVLVDLGVHVRLGHYPPPLKGGVPQVLLRPQPLEYLVGGDLQVNTPPPEPQRQTIIHLLPRHIQPTRTVKRYPISELLAVLLRRDTNMYLHSDTAQQTRGPPHIASCVCVCVCVCASYLHHHSHTTFHVRPVVPKPILVLSQFCIWNWDSNLKV